MTTVAEQQMIPNEMICYGPILKQTRSPEVES